MVELVCKVWAAEEGQTREIEDNELSLKEMQTLIWNWLLGTRRLRKLFWYLSSILKIQYTYPSLNQYHWLCSWHPIPECLYILNKQKKTFTLLSLIYVQFLAKVFIALFENYLAPTFIT